MRNAAAFAFFRNIVWRGEGLLELKVEGLMVEMGQLQ
jgi:hypothetical protein